MTDKPTAQVIAYPKDNVETRKEPETTPQTTADEFLDRLAAQKISAEQLRNELRRVFDEVAVLRGENRWQEIVDLFHPVEERLAELAEAGLAGPVRSEIAFAMGQLRRYDEAIKLARRCVEEQPEDFAAHARLAYAAYNSLYAAKNREILLHPEERRTRIELAHKHFAKAQSLRPDGVTNYYRQAMLFKAIQNQSKRALPIFETAARNWEKLDEEQKKARRRERKNYIKSLYQAASCLLDQGRAREALKRLLRCIEEDQASNHLSPVHKFFALAKIHYQRGDLEKARHALDFASAHADPAQHDYVYELRARIALAEGKIEEAQQALTCIPQHRRRPYVHWTHADVLVAEGCLDQARAVLKKSAERDRRGRHKAFIRLAKIDFRQNNLDECLQWADRADAFCRKTYQNPSDDALFWKAAACYRLGRYREAWKSARELDVFRPRYPHLVQLKKRIAQALNSEKEGRP